MFDEVLPALSLLFSGSSILYLLIGVAVGLLVGAIPGVGPTQAMALLLPLTIGMEPAEAIILLLATASASSQGGAVTAILLNTPGDSGNAASTFDGYQMTKKGEGAKALGAAATAGIIGSMIGIVILIAILPAGRWAVLQFSYADYFGLAVFGLAIIATLGTASMYRGLASGIAGLLASTVGMSVMTGEGRFVFGTEFLLDGLNLVAVLIGIFAVAEGFRLVSGSKALTDEDRAKLASPVAQALAGVRSVFTHWRVTVRSSVVGTLVGIVPGVGGVMSNFLAYGLAAKRAKVSADGSDVGFGKGDVRGVIAPEAANNGKEGGALLPTLIFGIPGSVSMALLLAALTVHGISAGPRMMIDEPTTVLLLIMVGVTANALSSLSSFSLIPIVGQLGKLNPTMLGSLLIAIGLSSAFLSEQGRFGDVWIALFFGLLGLLMSIGGYAPVTFVIGFVLGPLMERSLFQTIQVSGGSAFFTRPISAGLLLASVVIMLVPAVQSLRKRAVRRRAARADGEAVAVETQSDVGHPLVDLAFVGLFVYFLFGAMDADDPFTRLLPQGYAVVGIVLVLLANSGRIVRLFSQRGGALRPGMFGERPASEPAPLPVAASVAAAGPEASRAALTPSSAAAAAETVEAPMHAALEAEAGAIPIVSPSAWWSTAIGVGGALVFAILVTATVLSWVAAFVTVFVTALALRQHWRGALTAAVSLATAVFLLTEFLLGVPI